MAKIFLKWKEGEGERRILVNMINLMCADKEMYKPSTDSENCCQFALEAQRDSYK